MKKTTMKKVILLGLMCGNFLACNNVWAAAVNVDPTSSDKLDSPSNNSVVVGKTETTAKHTGKSDANWITVESDGWGNVYGGYIGDGSTQNNDIVINDGSIGGQVYGGFTSGIMVTSLSNGVTVNGGSFNGAYIGGGICAGLGAVEDCNLVVNAGSFTGSYEMYGGKASGDAADNSVKINGGSFSSNTKIYGGHSGNNATYNTVAISGATTGDVKVIYGGYGGTGASYNKVVIDSSYDGTVEGSGETGSVTGGWAANGGNANNNLVEIANGIYSHIVVGGNVQNGSGNANNNVVNISGGSYKGIYAGVVNSGTGSAENNILNISGGTFVGDRNVYGGYGKTMASYNSVNIGGTATGDIGSIYGGHGATGAGYNSIVINSSVKVSGVYGGYSDNGAVKDNTVDIGKCNVTGMVYGGYSDKSDAIHNTVNINGGKIQGTIYGGYSYNSGKATDNTVILNGGDLSGTNEICGGYSIAGDATNNTVIFNGNNLLAGNIYGGSVVTSGKISSGNTLVVCAKNINVKLVQDFQNYIFNVVNATKVDVMLKITETTDLNLGNATISADLSNSMIKNEDNIVLVEMTQAKVIGLDTATKKVYGSSDGIANYTGEIRGDDEVTGGFRKVIVKTQLVGLNPDGSKAPVEGMAAAATTVNSSSDLAIGAGIDNLITNTATVSCAETFGAANFGKGRYETGSHADASGYGLMAGVGKKIFDKNGNKTTGGIFFEYGNSNFDTYNNNVTGSGKSIYKGGGYIMRWDNLSGNYYEGMIHAGKLTTHWNNSSGGYNMSPTYYGGALTYGHKFMVGQNRQVSVYSSYIYSHTGGGDAKIGNYNYNFEATKSHRTKVGIRYAVSDLMDTKKFRPYVGLAWEHEFDGESRANISTVGFGGRPAAPSMKGDSGILEFGCKQEVGKWTLGIGAELFTGKRRGWNGTLEAIYNF